MAEVPSPAGRPAVRLVGVVVLVAAVVAVVALMLQGGGAPRAVFLPRPGVYVTDIVKSEETYDVANPSVKGTFVKGLKGRDWALCGSGLTDDFVGRFPKVADGADLNDGAIALRDYGQVTLPDLRKEAFLAVLKEHVDGWAAVERTTWRPFEFLLDPGGKSAYASVHFQVAGVRPDRTRADVSGTVRVGLVTADGTTWRIRRFEWAEGCRAEGRRAPWEDITDASGLHLEEGETARKMRQQMINDRGIVTLGSLVVEDVNGDGFVDVMASAANNEVVQFVNDGKGGFARSGALVPREQAGAVYVRADLDGDGVDELASSHVLGYEGTKGWCALYVQRGGGWELVPRALEFEVPPGVRGVQVQGIVPHDADGDGRLDLFYCNYSNHDSNGPNFNRVAAYDGADNWLFMNKGGLKFSEESDRRGIAGTQFTYVAKFWDFDGDGDDDIFEGNDFGPNHLWRNKGGGQFEDAKEHIFGADSNYTMGVTIADWDNTGDWSMYISNMYSHAGNRIVPLAKDLGEGMRRLGLILAQGNQFYERKNGVWTETAVARGVNWADWAWACVFFDAENDGDRDLFVANGYTTHEDAKAPDF